MAAINQHALYKKLHYKNIVSKQFISLISHVIEAIPLSHGYPNTDFTYVYVS